MSISQPFSAMMTVVALLDNGSLCHCFFRAFKSHSSSDLVPTLRDFARVFNLFDEKAFLHLPYLSYVHLFFFDPCPLESRPTWLLISRPNSFPVIVPGWAIGCMLSWRTVASAFFFQTMRGVLAFNREEWTSSSIPESSGESWDQASLSAFTQISPIPGIRTSFLPKQSTDLGITDLVQVRIQLL